MHIAVGVSESFWAQSMQSADCVGTLYVLNKSRKTPEMYMHMYQKSIITHGL